uniref:Uncharacterized protein n=1 Tax=Setaria italica TaxID=4555 RepID=K3YXK6_SETIT
MLEVLKIAFKISTIMRRNKITWSILRACMLCQNNITTLGVGTSDSHWFRAVNIHMIPK